MMSEQVYVLLICNRYLTHQTFPLFVQKFAYFLPDFTPLLLPILNNCLRTLAPYFVQLLKFTIAEWSI